jgi:glycosyltransferase involved in cell wall biosynthesis
MLHLLNNSDNTIAISIVICAYNASTRIAEVLQSLCEQKFTSENFSWEVIVVDNNSNDNTTEIANSYINKIGNGEVLKVIFESKQGLIYARQCGYFKSKGKIISYVDDDNIVSSNYVENMYTFFDSHPQAGLVGPKILPLLDYEPPVYFEYIKSALALRDLGNENSNITYSKYGHPPGAGMTFPKILLMNFFKKDSFRLSGRKGESLDSGEDSIIAITIKNIGYEWWYNHEVIISHKLPQSRMSMSYLIKLFQGFGMSSAMINETIKGKNLTASDNFKYICKYTIRLIWHSIIKIIHPKKSKRQFSHLLTKMFFSAACSHINKFINLKNITNN